MEKELVHIHNHLIEKARAYNRNAQSELYQLYFQAMYNTSLRIVADSFLAEDIMQDSFIEAFKKIDKLSDNQAFGSWLKRIVVNKSINQIQRKEIIIRKDEVELTESQEDEVDFTAELNEIKAAMSQLAKNYRLIFSLYMIEGYDHEEIGQILGISASTSRSQLSRAKQKIQHLINKKRMAYEAR